jgi:UDP-N-acetyl-D-galactosamine dehydrogenase
VDPYYLAHKAKALGYHPQVILSGREVNDQMSSFISRKLIQLLAGIGKQIQDAKVLVLGVTFKENCPDSRNSKVFDIIDQLKEQGALVDAFDPYANAIEVFEKHQVQLITALQKYDVILLAVAHDFFKALDYAALKSSPDAIVYDTKAFLDRSIVTARL